MNLQQLFLIIAAHAAGGVRRHCEGPVIQNTHYSKEIIKKGIFYPRSLTFDHSTNDLFFSYCPDVENYSVRTAKINLDTNEFEDIEGARNGYTQSVDAVTNEVFIGGSDGIYKYNKANNRAELHSAIGTVIWKIFSKIDIYFTEYPTQFVYKIVGGTAYRVRDMEETLAKNFVIDNYEYLYFTNNSGLYRQKKGTKDAIYYEGTKDMYISGLSVNSLDEVHASTDNGIYYVSRKKQYLEKLLDVYYAYGLTFDDQNDIIFSDETTIFRLKPSIDQACVGSRL